MKRILLSILLLAYINSFSQEKIYGDFQLFQSKKEVKKIFKANKDKYQNISFGGLDFWIINKLAISSFIYENRKLIGIRLFSKSIAKSNDLQKQSIRDLDSYFMNNDFEVLYRQTHWDTPVFFDNAQSGVVYKSPKSDTVIDLRMRTEKVMQEDNSFMANFKNNHICIDIIPFSLYEKQISKRKVEKEIDNSDF
jgi:hypothetical protein